MHPELSEIRGNVPDDWPRPRVLISRCIQFDHCRWNGDMVASPYVEKLKKCVEFVTICPEADIGLGVPRKPVRLALAGSGIRMLQHETGLDVTARMDEHAEKVLADSGSIDGAILKEKSPSCGISNVKVYASPEEGAMVGRKGSGLFAAQWMARFPTLPRATEGHLFNYSLREHFYTRIFTIARFRDVLAAPTAKKLSDFQARHKLVLMCYHQTLMREMGVLAANHRGHDVRAVAGEYFSLLCTALARTPRIVSPVNVLMHAMGYFSGKISGAEKRHFLGLLDQYRIKKIPLSVCNAVISSWIVRFDEAYLADQYFFKPYPAALVELSDSGK